MTKNDQSDEHPQAPWWWGVGPVGAILIILTGIAWTLWAFLGTASADDPVAGYQGSKIVAVGLVLLGAAALERLRGRRPRTDGETGTSEDPPVS
ncbi:hypothetical protein OG302_20605 [Streptomyces sp. NBC_01283]|uniref:hypothetical protein n=1 Tax=Streptomyces sp. NBC_01283 TaxID=2903812 RepID=UPI00352C5FF4|nr:hypothetical protein OG302_20605 [Streptomyces sp. NBC_01283]